jgi:hypothetical protein
MARKFEIFGEAYTWFHTQDEKEVPLCHVCMSVCVFGRMTGG